MTCVWHFFLFVFFPLLAANQIQYISTESDPEAYLLNCVNIISGEYCESATDLVIAGPDALILQRFYSANNLGGEWSIFPQRFLVIGKDPSETSHEQFKALAFAGERSGGILPYSGWRNTNGMPDEPLRLEKVAGMVNTYAGEIKGQTNHQNNRLYCKGDKYELILGDGTKRVYKQVQQLPSLFLGEKLISLQASNVKDPEYYLLQQEILPSGNQLFFSYDNYGHLVSVEMKNKASTKTFSWIYFTYVFHDNECRVQIETSDAKSLIYYLLLENNIYRLTKVEGSHVIPATYSYQDVLVKKSLPEGRFLEIDYENGKVKFLKGPHPQTGYPSIIYSITYGSDFTDVFNALGHKVRYFYDKCLQLTSIERYDEQNQLYRKEQMFWGNTVADAGLLLAKTIGADKERIYSYRSFQYDKSGNVIEERLYGNLTGKQEVFLQVSPEGKLVKPEEQECHVKTFGYSTDGFNLLTKIGDCKGNQTTYNYKKGTNLLLKKLIFDKGTIKKRTFYTYNEDGVCVRIVEDDGSQEEESRIYDCGVNERHIKEIKPKETLPGVGFPEIIIEKALDLKNKEEILIKKLVNVYDEQSNLLSSSTYDTNDKFAFAEKRSYNAKGRVILEIDKACKEVSYAYDEVGNQISIAFPQENKTIHTVFDFHNQPIKTIEMTPEGQFSLHFIYDLLGRKVSSTDRFGHATHFIYDTFHRLIKVIHPEVFDEIYQVVRPTFNYTYDIFGNVLTIQDPKGFLTKKSYNLRGDPTKIIYPDGTFELFKYDTEGSLHRSLSRDQILIVYEYDYLGRNIYEECSTIWQFGVYSFLKGKTRKYNGFRCIYEKENKRIKRFYHDPTGRLSSIIEYGEKKEENDHESRRTDFFYDPLGRLNQKRVWFDKGPQDYSLECLKYDLSGNIIEKSIKDFQGNLLIGKGFTYNSHGKCLEEYNLENGVSLLHTIYNADGEPITYLDSLGQETKIIIDNSYANALGQLVLKKTIINPHGVQTEIEFDALNRVYSIIKKDEMGALLSSQKILYDTLGNKACEIHDQIWEGKIIDSQKICWIHDSMGKVQEEIHAAGSPLEKRYFYGYNSQGKIATRTIHGMEWSINYTYNTEGRLRKLEAEDRKTNQRMLFNYSYDSNGNLKAASELKGPSFERAYNDFDQLIKETIKDGEGSYTLEFAYDRKGRIKEIALPDNSKIGYFYDALYGRQVKRISAAGEVLYTHTYDKYNSLGKLLSETYMGCAGSKEYTYNHNGQLIATKDSFFNEEYSRDFMGRLIEINGKNHEEYSYNGLSQLTTEKK